MSESTPPRAAAPYRVQVFVPVLQRRLLDIDARLLPLVEPLFLVPTHMSFEERLALFQAALSLPADFTACEVGSYLGASAAFLAAAATQRGGRIHCVDTWQNEAMLAEPPEDTFAEFLRNTVRFRCFLAPHRGPAAEQAASVPGGLDFLFIDGDHAYEAVASDLACYAPKLRPGGVLALHDFGVFPGVERACAEFFRGRPPEPLGRVHSLQLFRVLQSETAS